MEPVPMAVVAMVVVVLAVALVVWSRRHEPGHARRELAVAIATAELIAGSLLLLAGDVGKVQVGTGAAFLAAGFIELGDAAKRAADAADRVASAVGGRGRRDVER